MDWPDKKRSDFIFLADIFMGVTFISDIFTAGIFKAITYIDIVSKAVNFMAENFRFFMGHTREYMGHYSKRIRFLVRYNYFDTLFMLRDRCICNNRGMRHSAIPATITITKKSKKTEEP